VALGPAKWAIRVCCAMLFDLLDCSYEDLAEAPLLRRNLGTAFTLGATRHDITSWVMLIRRPWHFANQGYSLPIAASLLAKSCNPSSESRTRS